MTTPQIVAQILGILLIITCAISPQMKKKSGIIFFLLIGNVLWTLQFVLLGEVAGALTGCVNIARSAIFYFYARKERKAPLWILILILSSTLTINIIKWEHWYNILLILSMVYSYGQWQNSKTVLRYTLIIATIFNGAFCLITGAYTGALNEYIQTISAVVALWRYRKSANVTTS